MWDEPRVALFQLHEDCSASLQKILREIFALPITKHAIAQVFDGLPVRDDYCGPSDPIDYVKNPEIASRDMPTPEGRAFASSFCSSLDVQSVSITAKTAEKYQQAVRQDSPSGLPTALHFLEASSSIFHDIISKIHAEFHPHDSKAFSRQDIHHWNLVHPCYSYSATYKNDFASTPAYWAETLVFGGPVMFKRGKDGKQCDAAFIHPREGKIAQLMDHQIRQYLVVSSEEPDSTSLSSILPFAVAPDARRLTIQEAIAEEIYREPGQIDYQWGDGVKYGMPRRQRCGTHEDQEREDREFREWANQERRERADRERREREDREVHEHSDQERS